ncbi:uncharacterized protein CC84DRAFT_1179227 [Paraphaeosphaeria sporulosa]|uniref:Uncharacterized protein n=1 Tax=Paraphaeosphaeria sporulosa TaxID=1460663 RepID=A0A177C699_9PLEO|nr:uncharacterized protein CC84DRAFT_1179227 [Paraphaeosphaeria sporulosa]OAG02298.1 hypothetical protein CC84DRAFT_1179227 [Paraphaeosphaeria sporulosa]
MFDGADLIAYTGPNLGSVTVLMLVIAIVRYYRDPAEDAQSPLNCTPSMNGLVQSSQTIVSSAPHVGAALRARSIRRCSERLPLQNGCLSLLHKAPMAASDGTPPRSSLRLIAARRSILRSTEAAAVSGQAGRPFAQHLGRCSSSPIGSLSTLAFSQCFWYRNDSMAGLDIRCGLFTADHMQSGPVLPLFYLPDLARCNPSTQTQLQQPVVSTRTCFVSISSHLRFKSRSRFYR